MNNNNIFITGGSGYIGSHLVRRLIQEGKTPIIFDIHQPTDMLVEAIYIHGDISDYEALESAFILHKPAVVIHLAAKTSVIGSEKFPQSYRLTNVDGGLNILKAMKSSDCKRVVFASSAAVYKNTELKIVETSETNPQSEYGKNKLEFENILIKEANKRSVSAVILRLFNVAGFCNNIATPANSLATTLLARATLVAQGKSKKIVLHGNVFFTRDGSSIRDYVHIGDVVEAFVQSCLFKINTPYAVVNIGSGAGTTSLEIIQKVEHCAKKTIPVEVRAGLPSEISQSVADITKAKSILGWYPKKTIEDIIVSTIQHYEKL